MGRRELAAETVVHQRYRVESVLGSGGFGITYRVMDLKYGRIAAMKEYMPLDAACRAVGGKTVRPVSQDRYAQYEKFRQQFLKEAQTIHRFRGHPNIVDVYHLFLENNTAYYVMEYLDGMDLKRFLASKRANFCPMRRKSPAVKSWWSSKSISVTCRVYLCTSSNIGRGEAMPVTNRI